MHPEERYELIHIGIMHGMRANPRNKQVLPQTLAGAVNQHAKFFVEAIDQHPISSGWKDEGDWQHRARMERIALANYDARLQACLPEDFDTDQKIQDAISASIQEAEQVLFMVENPSFPPVLTGTS